MSVGIHREKLSLHIVLNAPERLARGRIITVDQGLEAINSLDRVPTLPGTYEVLLEIRNQLVPILCKPGELGLLLSDRGDLSILDDLLDTALLILGFC